MNLLCQSCGAALAVEAGSRTTVCPYCASPSVIEGSPSADRPAPAFALGFALGRAAAQERVSRWLRGQSLFARSGVRNARVEDVRGVYVPAYLYSAVSRSEYTAEIGEDYTDTETYTSHDSKGGTATHTRTVTRTEWLPLQGAYASYVPDVLVTASRGLPHRELDALEPFDLRLLSRYAPALVSGWIAEEPSRTRDECLGLAREEAGGNVGKALEGFLPGDHHRNLVHQTRLEEEVMDLVLVPVWVLTARYHPELPIFRLIVNGQTGKVHGQAPLSWIKVLAAALLAVATAAYFAGAFDALLPWIR